MKDQETPDAWIELASESEVRSHSPAGSTHPYDFGFVANMSRLLVAHDTIGPPFRALFASIMFDAGSLERQDREMVASVTAAAQDCFY